MMAAKKNSKIKKQEKGLASIETVIMVFIFVALLGSTLGFYGITQKMILHSIASRAYGFEQIRNRTNITYLRDIQGGNSNSYHVTKLRYFTVKEPGGGNATFLAAKMDVDFRSVGSVGGSTANPEAHNTTAYGDISRNRRNERHYFDKVWIKVGHGICLTAECGD